MAFLLLLLMVNGCGVTLQTTLHLIPGTKEVFHGEKHFTVSLKGKKKDRVDNEYESNIKLSEQGVIIPDGKGKVQSDSNSENEDESSKQKGEDRNIEKDFSSFMVDFRDITPTFSEQSATSSNIKTGPESALHLKLKNRDLVTRKNEADSKSVRIARLEKLARENLEEINRLKNDSLKESEEIKQETANKSAEARLIAEIGHELQNSSTGKQEKHITSTNDTALINYIVSATKYNQSNPNLESFVSMLPSIDERLLQENDAATGTSPILQKTEKGGRVTANVDKSEKEKQNEAKWDKFEKEKEMEAKVDKYEEDKKMESKMDKSKYNMQIEAKLDNPGNHIEAKLDEEFAAKGNSPEIAAIHEPLFPQPKHEETDDEKPPKEMKNEEEPMEARIDLSSQFNDKILENKIIEGTMMEAEILKSKHLKPNAKIKKKKVKILILDEEDLPVKKPRVQHVYDAEDRLPVYSTNNNLNHNQNLCNLLMNTNLMDTPSPLHANCPPSSAPPPPPPAVAGHPMPPSFTNEQPLSVQHTFNQRPLDVCCPVTRAQEMHETRRPFYPEYLRGYLRHKIRHRYTQNNMENMQEALQPQIHYHFNFMKENNGRHVGTEESLTKGSLSTDWSDRKRGSLAKASDLNNPLIDKFIAFIKSPSSDIPDPNRKHVQATYTGNTLINPKYKKLDGSLSKLHTAYKRSRTTVKKGTLPKTKNKI